MENNKIRMNRQDAVRFLKFTAFSISAGALQFISFTALLELAKLGYWPSYLAGLILSVLYNFTVNRRFTFKSVANIPLAMLKVTGYYLVFTPASTWWGKYLTDTGWNDYIVLIGTMIINLVTEFLFYRIAVYRTSLDTRVGKHHKAEEPEEK